MATIAIDLGTYNSAAGYMLPDGTVALLQAYHGETYQGLVMPSFVKFMANGEFEKYGEKAREDLGIAPNLVVWGVKRLLGQPYQKAEEKGELDRFQYRIEEAPDGSILIPISDKKYTPVEITRILLEKIKADCESPSLNPILGKRVTKAIITHPAYFDGLQIKAVKDAVKGAGFGEFELLTEPEAAARAYKDILDFKSETWVLVIDWGAGTLDMVIAKFHLDGNGNPRITSVSPPYGDNRLGGIDMDDALLKEAERIYYLDNMTAKEKGNLRIEIERGKIDLSTKPSVKRYFLYKGKNMTLKMARNIECIPDSESREGWILLEGDPDKKTKGALDDILLKFRGRLVGALQGIGPLEIDQLILVGGPMYIPCVRKVIKDVFKDNERGVLQQLELIEKEDFPVKPLEAVVRGATIYSSPNSGGITTNMGESAYGYGYLLGGMIGEILIPPKMHGGVERQTKSPLRGVVLPDESIPLSLIKLETEKMFEERKENYFRRGDYNFTLVPSPMGTSFTPIVELDKDLIPILKIKDHNSPNPPLTLYLSGHQDSLIVKPMTPDEFKKFFENLSEDEKKELDKVMRERFKDLKKPISPEKVEKLRQEAESAIRFIESEQSSGKTLSNETLEKKAELKQALDKLPSGSIPPELHFRYTAVFNTNQELRNRLVKAGYSEEELRL